MKSVFFTQKSTDLWNIRIDPMLLPCYEVLDGPERAGWAHALEPCNQQGSTDLNPSSTLIARPKFRKLVQYPG